MDKELLDYTAERAKILSEAQSSKQATKDAAIAWMDAVDGADDATIEAATNDFVTFLEGRPNTIDGVIAFLQGPAIEMFGKELAEQKLAKQQQRKEQGERYCDCDACTAAVEILTKHGRI